MAGYLGIGLAPPVTGLAPQVWGIIGEVTAWDRVGPIVLDVVKRRTLPPNTTQIVPTDPATQPRLRGAVTLVVQRHFGVILATPDMEDALVRKLYELPPPGQRELYMNIFDRRIELRPQIEIRGYAVKTLWDDYRQFEAQDASRLRPVIR